MKSLNLALCIAAFAGTACLGGTVPAYKLNQAAAISGVTGGGGLPPEAIAAHCIVNELGDVVFNGRIGSSSVAIAAGTAPSFAPINGQTTFTYVPAQAATFAAVTNNAVTGSFYKLIITTSGTTSYTLTFGTGFTGAGTLETGTTTAIVYALDFVYDGTTFRELGRRRQGVPVVTVPVVATTSTLPYAEGVVLYNWTPVTSENLAVNVAGRAGATIYVHIIGDASAARTTTFTTNIKASGTLATGSSGATDSTITFVSDGTSWREFARTTGQTP